MADGETKLQDINILLAVTGGVAAYKAVDLASRLTARGATVRCVMTDAAQELVSAKTFEAVTRQPVFTKMWSAPADYSIAHIDLADSTDIVVVAPATANIIAKIASGICDDLLSTTLCACWNKPFVVAPAMNSSMWANPVVQRNIEILKGMTFTITGPETGRLACGTEGIGRMTEPAEILAVIESIAAQIRKA
jgi:phosphopantothenoylcysteine decarboxylase/phosphopantothenate--cysteine ligase